MCGNVGAISRETTFGEQSKIINFFRQALIVDSVRGLDATGVATITDKGKLSIRKRAVASQEFLEDNSVVSSIRDGSNVIFCGHNRAATTGSLTDQSAHPFKHGDITLFHNGTLDYWSDLTSKDKYFSIDSEAICSSIDSNGVISTLENLSGAFALVWYDSSNKTVNFARNSERPLFFGYTPKTNSIVYASEEGMISWLAEKNGIELESIKSLAEGNWLSIPLDPEIEITSKKFKPKPKELSNWHNYYNDYSYYGSSKTNENKNYNNIENEFKHLKSAILNVRFNRFCPYSSSKSSNVYGYVMGEYSDYYENKIPIRVSGVSESEALEYFKKDVTVRVSSVSNVDYLFANILAKKELERINIPSEISKTDQLTVENISKEEESQDCSTGSLVEDKNIIGPKGFLITEERFNELVRHGCGFCSCDLEIEDQAEIVWTISNEPVCLECAIQEEIL